MHRPLVELAAVVLPGYRMQVKVVYKEVFEFYFETPWLTKWLHHCRSAELSSLMKLISQPLCEGRSILEMPTWFYYKAAHRAF